jgi:splicing factor 3A subunit 2
MDRQNRVGSKFGGGGVSSAAQTERERKERLKQLALESIDLAKDPYLVCNHLGSYECSCVSRCTAISALHWWI